MYVFSHASLVFEKLPEALGGLRSVSALLVLDIHVCIDIRLFLPQLNPVLQAAAFYTFSKSSGIP